MKKITFFYLTNCPYCHKAEEWLDELMEEEPLYKQIEFENIEEEKHADIADKYDYYYVPTFYVDGEKLHEGAATKEKIKAVLDAALEDPKQ